MTSIVPLLMASLAMATETCAPPDLQPSPRAADTFFLYEPPLLATEDHLQDPGSETADRGAAMQAILRARMASMRADNDVGSPPRKSMRETTWLFSHASGWLEVPIGLQIRVMAVGVDGSWLLELADAEGLVRFKATSTGACVGCAMSEAALWFPEQVQAARDNEFLYCERFQPSPAILSRTATRVRWQRQLEDSREQLQGVVVDRTTEHEGLRSLTVSGLSKAVTDTLLEGFGR